MKRPADRARERVKRALDGDTKPADLVRERFKRALDGDDAKSADLAHERFERSHDSLASCQNKLSDQTAMGKKKKKVDPGDLIEIPMEDLVLAHSEIGVHRGRKYGFRDVFGFRTLYDVPFEKLAKKVKAAYEGEDVPKHKGWPDQREALKWLVDKGADAMYQFKDDIRVTPGPGRRYYIAGGNHRSLALYILGADSVRAAIVNE